jgi:hypothetical protein
MERPNKIPIYTKGLEILEEAAKDAKQMTNPTLIHAV